MERVYLAAPGAEARPGSNQPRAALADGGRKERTLSSTEAEGALAERLVNWEGTVPGLLRQRVLLIRAISAIVRSIVQRIDECLLVAAEGLPLPLPLPLPPPPPLPRLRPLPERKCACSVSVEPTSSGYRGACRLSRPSPK
jgi:hypothetical protein